MQRCSSIIQIYWRAATLSCLNADGDHCPIIKFGSEPPRALKPMVCANAFTRAVATAWFCATRGFDPSLAGVAARQTADIKWRIHGKSLGSPFRNPDPGALDDRGSVGGAVRRP